MTLERLLVIAAVVRAAMPGLSVDVAIRVGIRKATLGVTGLRVVNLTVVGLPEGTAIVVWLIGIVAIIWAPIGADVFVPEMGDMP